MFVELGNGDSHDDEGQKFVTCGSRQMDAALLTDLQLQHRLVPWYQGEDRELHSV